MEQTNPVPVRRDFLTRITPERAQFMAARRRQLKEEREAAALKAEQQAQELALLRQPEPDPFHSKTLTRVRAQMSRLLSLAEKESDPAKLDRLAAAFAKHEEVERRLSDRSLPAVRRVQDTPKSKASRLFG